MNDRDRRRSERLTRVQTFAAENAADFAPGAKALGHFIALTGHLGALERAVAAQPAARVSKESLLAELLLDFQNIARTARAIAAGEPGFETPYLTPLNRSESSLVAHADSLLLQFEEQPADTAAEKAAKAALRDRFIAYEMAADFVADLRADREALRQANSHNNSENLEGVENTAAIATILAAADAEVLQLDAIMHNKYGAVPEKLHAWQRASRVERSPRRRKADDDQGAAPDSTAPTPPPAV